ncbi:MAG: ATP-binding protein [Cyclobacteriaceae bacterium]
MIKSDNLLQDLFEDSGTIVLITDEKFRIRYSSSSVQTLLGIEPISIIGKNAFDFAPSDKRQVWQTCIEQAGKAMKAEILLKSTHGTDLYFDVSVANRIANHEIHGLVIMLHDVTSQKQRAITLEKEKEQLDQFIYKTTHDLRAPIHSALGLLNLMKLSSENEREQYITMMGDTLNKLESLIEEVNHLYRVDKMAVTIERIDIQSLIDNEIGALKNYPNADNILFEHNHSIQAELFSDALRVRTIVSNILSNGVKYSDFKKDVPAIHIETIVDEENFILVFSDNGIGIADENIEKIFDIFYRATDEASGTGLGLHIVKDTVKRLKGTIEVKSHLGSGTQFKVSLPNHLLSMQRSLLSLDAKKAVL